jgi:uncharacterized protein YkwD
MYRVVLPLLLSLASAGCSLGSTQSLSLGFKDPPKATSEPLKAPVASLGGDPRQARVESASYNVNETDRAPKGSYDRAQRNALAARDYSDTLLDAEKARETINAYRKANGLKPLTLNAELTAAAKSHSRDLAKWDRISHYGSDGSNPWDRVKRAGYNSRVAAENVGTGQNSFDEVMKGWQASPGHNKNLLLADADNMGIALVQDSKTEFKTFWTLVIGSRL